MSGFYLMWSTCFNPHELRVFCVRHKHFLSEEILIDDAHIFYFFHLPVNTVSIKSTSSIAPSLHVFFHRHNDVTCAMTLCPKSLLHFDPKCLSVWLWLRRLSGSRMDQKLGRLWNYCFDERVSTKLCTAAVKELITTGKLIVGGS